jgi:hypothetical protein
MRLDVHPRVYSDIDKEEYERVATRQLADEFYAEKIKQVSEQIEKRLLEMKELRLSPEDLKKANREYLKQKQMEKQGDFWHPDELQRLSPDPKISVPRSNVQKRQMG